MQKFTPFLSLLFVGSLMATRVSKAADTTGSYAQVNGLKMYYEMRGSDSTNSPLVLLHGAFGSARGWGAFLPLLEKSRKLIVVELQGHGHTADRDQAFTHEQMADDVAELLKHLKIQSADLFGFSMGGTVAL